MLVQKIFTERRTKNEFNTLVLDLMLFGNFYVFQMFRMSLSHFKELLSQVAPRVIKCSKFRDVSTTSERICLTLRYQVTGDAQVTIVRYDCVSPLVVSRINHITCDAIWTVIIHKEYLNPIWTGLLRGSSGPGGRLIQPPLNISGYTCLLPIKLGRYIKETKIKSLT